MNKLSRTDLPVFNLLSIGQRGVGKTVFLAGSYMELQANLDKDNGQSWWLECENSQEQDVLEGILEYIARTGQYPPPTMKIADFNLSLKYRNRRGEKTLCHFRWWDIPGESCNLRDPYFQQMVLNSHSCCFFINAEALVKETNYLETIESALTQAIAIASLVNQHHLDYSFALIFTQCDLLEPGPVGQLQIEERVQPLLARLDSANAKYQKFYSAIPIVSYQGNYRLTPTGASAPLLWLLSELNKTGQVQTPPTLEAALKHNVPTTTNQRQSTISSRKYIPRLVLASVGVLGVCAVLVFSLGRMTPISESPQTPGDRIVYYERILQRDPNNFGALIELANLYIEEKQLDKAIPVLEKIVAQQPSSLDWQFILAQIYENREEKQKAETVYDRILAMQENNLEALIKKAILRSELGDPTTAKTLFAKAEKVAPTDSLKAKVRAIAQSVLSPTSSSAN
jgi:tetratricopeptide (TPR) repeat protein